MQESYKVICFVSFVTVKTNYLVLQVQTADSPVHFLKYMYKSFTKDKNHQG